MTPDEVQVLDKIKEFDLPGLSEDERTVIRHELGVYWKMQFEAEHMIVASQGAGHDHGWLVDRGFVPDDFQSGMDEADSRGLLDLLTGSGDPVIDEQIGYVFWSLFGLNPMEG